MHAPAVNQKTEWWLLASAVLAMVMALTHQGREITFLLFFSAPLVLGFIAVSTLLFRGAGLVFSLLLSAFALFSACFNILFP